VKIGAAPPTKSKLSPISNKNKPDRNEEGHLPETGGEEGAAVDLDLLCTAFSTAHTHEVKYRRKKKEKKKTHTHTHTLENNTPRFSGIPPNLQNDSKLVLNGGSATKWNYDDDAVSPVCC
jgi:hypothetical protein